METKRIAFFCWESLHSVRAGGLAAAATYLAESLAQDHEIHYFVLGLPDQIEKKDVEINGVEYHRCFPTGPNIVEYCNNMGISMADDFKKEEKKGEFDVLHFHDWHPTEALHLLQDRNTIVTLHSTEYGRNGNEFGDWWEFRDISGKEWYSALISNKVTTVSQTLKNEVMWLYNAPDWKVEVTPNGVHPERYYKEVNPDEVKKEYGLRPKTPLVFYMGRLVPQKGPDILMNAISTLMANDSDVKFFFAGTGDMYTYLLTRASTNNATRMLGYISDQELIKLLNASDLVVIPSRNEPFGLVLLEAWSARRGVVASDVGGLQENIDNFENGIKVFPNSDSIAWGINYALNLSDPYKMGKKGRKKVETEFKWDTVAEKMVDIYDNL